MLRRFILLQTLAIVACNSPRQTDPQSLGQGSPSPLRDKEPTTTDQASAVRSALISENWVAGIAGHNLNEPYSFQALTAQGWEIINTFNGGSGTNLSYSCNVNQGAFTNWVLPLPAGETLCCDPSGFGKTSGPLRAYSFFLKGGGITFATTGEPCPAAGTPSWTVGSFGFPAIQPASLDYPHAFYNTFLDEAWMVFNGSPAPSGTGTIGILKLNSAGSGGSYILNACDNHVKQWANGDVDRDGHPVVVYLDATTSRVRFIRFNRVSFSFDCASARDIGTHTYQPAGCSPTCPGAAIPNVGAGCLEDSYNSTIAVDRLTIPNKILIAFGTRGTGACTGFAETRFYRSLDNGNTWPSIVATGCQTAVQPRATAGQRLDGLGTGNLFHVVTAYATGGGLAQVDWKSSDGGATWSGAFISGQRAAPPGCFWGHYHGVTTEINNEIYTNWMQMPNPSGNWGIRGMSFPF